MRACVALVFALSVAALTTGCAASSTTGSGAAGGAAGGATGASDPRALVLARCTVCHSVDRIAAAQHDQTGWSATVARMIGKGARLNSEEAKAVIDFLTQGGNLKLK